MTTRPYDDCLTMALALCGIPDSSAVETARVGVFLNGRARKAYAASQYWPRWLKVEERICSEEGLVPYEEDGLDTIKTAMRIHASEPYADQWAGEYGNFVAKADGIQITGYQASEYSGYHTYTVTGTLTPDVAGDYEFDYTTSISIIYRNPENSNQTIAGTFVSGSTSLVSQWGIINSPTQLDLWTSEISEFSTPDEVVTWTAQGSATGTPVVTKNTRYSAWITYKSAFTTTYASGDDVPEEWFDYMAHGAYADFLRNEGQQEKAVLAEAEAQAKLDEQLEQIDRQSGSHAFTRVFNHGNTQSR